MTEKKGDPQPKRRVWADLGPRLISAMILMPVTALALFLGGIWFALLVGAVFAGAYREWEIMVTGQQPDGTGFALIGLIALSAVVFPYVGISGSLVVIAAAFLLALALPSASRMWRAGGTAYFGLVIIAVLAMRGTANLGITAGVFLAVSVWMTDSAAFFTGRQIGGAKLSPDISPSKTRAGAFGGLAIGTLAGTITWIVATPSPWWIGFCLAALFSVSGQIGDLAESAAKRRFRIKDSSELIPGHGGLMDRLDSLTLAVLVLFAVGVIHAGPEAIAAGVLIW